MPIIVLLFTLTLMCGLICHILAEKRGRKRATWAVLGLLLGPFAVFALLVLGKAKTPDNTTNS